MTRIIIKYKAHFEFFRALLKMSQNCDTLKVGFVDMTPVYIYILGLPPVWSFSLFPDVFYSCNRLLFTFVTVNPLLSFEIIGKHEIKIALKITK